MNIAVWMLSGAIVGWLGYSVLGFNEARGKMVSIVIGAIGEAVSSPAHPVDIDAGFSINGWLAVLLTFLLARVFAEGTLMREDLEGTV